MTINGGGILYFIREYWVVVVFIGAVVTGWTTFEARLSNVESRISVVEMNTSTNKETIHLIQQSLATIEANLEFIKQRVQ